MRPKAHQYGLAAVLGAGGIVVTVIQANLAIAIGNECFISTDIERVDRQRYQGFAVFFKQVADRDELLVVQLTGLDAMLFKQPAVELLNVVVRQRRHEQVVAGISNLILSTKSRASLLSTRLRTVRDSFEVIPLKYL